MRDIIDENLPLNNMGDTSILSKQTLLPPRSRRDTLKRENSQNFQGVVHFKQRATLDVPEIQNPRSSILSMNLVNESKDSLEDS